MYDKSTSKCPLVYVYEIQFAIREKHKLKESNM